MAWDSSAAMERLSRTNEWVQSLKQRKKEANRQMLQDLLGSGIDVWKTLYGGNLQKTSQLSAQEHDKSMAYQQQGENVLERLWKAGEAAKGREFEAEEAGKGREFEAGEAGKGREFTTGRDLAQHGYTMEELRERANQEIRIGLGKGVDASNVSKIWDTMLSSAFTEGALVGVISKDEMGNDVLLPTNAERFRTLLKVPSGLSPADAMWLQEKIDSFMSSIANPVSQDNGPVEADISGPRQEEMETHGLIKTLVEKAQELVNAGYGDDSVSNLKVVQTILDNIEKPGTSSYVTMQPGRLTVAKFKDIIEKAYQAYMASKAPVPQAVPTPNSWNRAGVRGGPN